MRFLFLKRNSANCSFTASYFDVRRRLRICRSTRKKNLIRVKSEQSRANTSSCVRDWRVVERTSRSARPMARSVRFAIRAREVFHDRSRDRPRRDYDYNIVVNRMSSCGELNVPSACPPSPPFDSRSPAIITVYQGIRTSARHNRARVRRCIYECTYTERTKRLLEGMPTMRLYSCVRLVHLSFMFLTVVARNQ